MIYYIYVAYRYIIKDLLSCFAIRKAGQKAQGYSSWKITAVSKTKQKNASEERVSSCKFQGLFELYRLAFFFFSSVKLKTLFEILRLEHLMRGHAGRCPQTPIRRAQSIDESHRASLTRGHLAALTRSQLNFLLYA